jgi:DNA repair exonuclease SbcCD ATPase subunit
LISFERLAYKNFLSTGNIFTEIPLNQHSNALIVGENGAGKSTILDALTFVLYGKAFRRINKPALINSVNERDCLVEIEFTSDNKKFKVIRGMKPNIFEIYCNGTLLKQSSASRDYQEFLEKFILKMSYKSFVQVVILGSASFTPFMQLTPAERRLFIEDLLDIQVFSTMNVIVKQRLQANRENYEKNRISIEVKSEKLTFIEKTLSSMKVSAEEKINDIDNKCMQIETNINLLEVENNQHKVAMDHLSREFDDLEKLRSKYKNLISLQSKIENNMDRSTKDIGFYHDNNNCPTCRQSIDSTFKAEIVTELSTKCEKYNEGLVKIKEEIDSCIVDIQGKERAITAWREHQKSFDINTTKITMLTSEHNKLTSQLRELESNDTIYNDSKTEYETTLREIEELENKRKELVEERSYIDTAITLLKDGGIKTKIIKQYLPVINKLINKYLSQMGFFVLFEINENFEETIKSRHRDEFSYFNFSEGEKMRIDLAILFTWRNIAKMRNSVHTNLLVLDEVFDSSLDANGTDEFLKIMWDMIEGTNCFVISHKTDALLDRFEKTYRFTKKKNFSCLEV